jgi:hypothetical protein
MLLTESVEALEEGHVWAAVVEAHLKQHTHSRGASRGVGLAFQCIAHCYCQQILIKGPVLFRPERGMTDGLLA